jgi:hemerythrin superfamily protein
MIKKLTIKLDQKVIEKAKNYARNSKTSLSNIIESYLQKLTSGSESEEDDITPLVKSLSGIVKNSNWENAKQDYKLYLKQRYSKDHI